MLACICLHRIRHCEEQHEPLQVCAQLPPALSAHPRERSASMAAARTPRNTPGGHPARLRKTECLPAAILGTPPAARRAAGDQRRSSIYPMNALATDRPAAIASHPLHPALAVCAQVSTSGLPMKAPPRRDATSVITDKKRPAQGAAEHPAAPFTSSSTTSSSSMVPGPLGPQPSIANGTKPLRYLVVDEFHTFDGAQGIRSGLSDPPPCVMPPAAPAMRWCASAPPPPLVALASARRCSNTPARSFSRSLRGGRR